MTLSIRLLLIAYTGTRMALKEDYDLLFATSRPLTAGIPGIFAKWFRRKPFQFVFEVRGSLAGVAESAGTKRKRKHRQLLLPGSGVQI